MAAQTVEEIYIGGLLQDEAALTQEEEALNAARARFDLAGHRYAGTRDMVTVHLNGSPYAESFLWPLEIPDLILGRFRFINMQTGDAVKQVLREAAHPLALVDIVKKLQEGRSRATSRTVNAALMQLSGVEKTKDDRYRYNVDQDVDTLPF